MTHADGNYEVEEAFPSNFQMVRQFHEKFGLTEDYPERPDCLTDKDFLFRYHLCEEEMLELLSAHRRRDIVEVADALADLLYVTYGLALAAGVPMDAVFAEVHRANMRKVRSKGIDDPLGKRSSKSDVLKPPGWQPPDVAAILGVGR